MIYIANKVNCCGCEACANVCPVSCIKMVLDEEGFRYPSVDPDVCIDCGLCEAGCPERNPVYPLHEAFEYYAAYSLDGDYRANSSSGGLFYELAKQVIGDGGIVCGAAYDEEFNVCHKCVGSLVELKSLLGSKYVQSHIGDSFKQVKTYLEEDRPVLFVGTECQVAGLKKFLGKDDERLLTVGVVCHGVPSLYAWRSYIGSLENSDQLASINMRDKSSGWSNYNYSWKFVYKDGTERCLPQREISYMNGFVADYYLRPSCYACSFKGLRRSADLTLGDFWGIWDCHPDMDDDRGTSLIMVHTGKGRLALDIIWQNIKSIEVSQEDAVLQNPSILTSAVLSSKRAEFFERLMEEESFDSIVKSLSDNQRSTARRVIHKLKQLF